jgi:hypothetical protein
MSNLKKSFKKFFVFLLVYSFTLVSVEALNPGIFEKFDRNLIKVFDQDSSFDSRTFPISYTYSMSYIFPVIPTPTFQHVYSLEGHGEHLPVTLIESDTSRISRLNGFILVNVSTPNETMYDITDYEYSTDDGVTWRSNGTGPFSGNPADAPVVIQKLSVDGTTNLSSNSTYPIKIRAIGYLNWGHAHFDYQTRVEGIPSETYFGRTAGVPNITEIIGSITSGNRRLSFEVYTDEPGGNGGFNITDYEYSTDDGVSWRSAGVSPVPDGGDVQVVITKLSSDGVTNLSDNTTYQVKVRAVNNFGGTKAGKGTPSIRYLGSTYGVPGKPEIFSVEQGNLQFTLNSSGDEIDNGGFSISDWQYSTDNGSSWKSTGQTGLTLNDLIISQVSGSSENLVRGVTYQIKVRAINSAGNGPASDSFSITATSTRLVAANQTIAAEYSDSGLYDLVFPSSGPVFSISLTANSLSLTGISGFDDVKSIMWNVLDSNNNQLFLRGDGDDNILDWRESVNENPYNSVGTSYLTSIVTDASPGGIPFESLTTFDPGNELIIRDCESNDYDIPYLDDAGTVEIPGTFVANTEYRIYISTFADAGFSCGGTLIENVIFTGIYTTQHDVTYEATHNSLDITVSNWDSSTVSDFAFVLCEADNPAEETFSECINAPPYDIDSNDDDVIDDWEFFASDYDDWTTYEPLNIYFDDLKPNTNYDFYLQFFEQIGSDLILMENYSLTEGYPYDEPFDVTAEYRFTTSEAPPPSSSGGGSSGGGSSGGAPGISPPLPNVSIPGSPFVLPNPLNIKDSLFKSLTASEIGSISASQLSKLPGKTIALLSSSQASQLTVDQLKALKPSQVAFLKPSVIAVLTSNQIAALQPSDFRLMRATQIARISAEAISGLTGADLRVLNQNQLRSFKPNVIANIRPVALKSLSILNLRNLTRAQKQSITDLQRKALTVGQIRAISI